MGRNNGFRFLLLSALLLVLAGCFSNSPSPRPDGPPFSAAGQKSRIPMSQVLKTNDWETLDSLWGVNVKRHIIVNTSGFSLRVKSGPFGGAGNSTPGCVEYGSITSVIVDTVQVKGAAGARVDFEQGVGSCL